MSCNGFHPTHQAQLEYRWGGKYGGANCTACAAGMTGESHTCGALRFTGAQVRAASNEPTPDPKSPGLNLAQVDSALYHLSAGEIDLDTHYRYPFDSLEARLNGGAQAILQGKRSVLVTRGEGHGNSFPGGHAITVGVDDIGPWLDDPLTGRFPTTWGTLRSFAGSLVLNDQGETCGYGKAYAAFSRDITSSWHVRFDPGRFFAYTMRDGMIWSRERLAFSKATGAPCRAPRRFLAHPKGPLKGTPSRRLAILTAGSLKDKGVQEASTHVHVEEAP